MESSEKAFGSGNSELISSKSIFNLCVGEI